MITLIAPDLFATGRPRSMPALPRRPCTPSARRSTRFPAASSSSGTPTISRPRTLALPRQLRAVARARAASVEKILSTEVRDPGAPGDRRRGRLAAALQARVHAREPGEEPPRRDRPRARVSRGRAGSEVTAPRCSRFFKNRIVLVILGLVLCRAPHLVRRAPTSRSPTGGRSRARARGSSPSSSWSLCWAALRPSRSSRPRARARSSRMRSPSSPIRREHRTSAQLRERFEEAVAALKRAAARRPQSLRPALVRDHRRAGLGQDHGAA